MSAEDFEPLGDPDRRVPFASPVPLSDGKYGLLQGEIEYRANAVGVCPTCDTLLALRVGQVTLGEPVSRIRVQDQWKSAGEKILKWLLREKA
jgi:hypothetical protein